MGCKPLNPSDLGAWQPASPIEAAELFTSVAAPWWVAGGLALDLFLGRTTRHHEDLDVGVLRRDILEVLRPLWTWEVFAAKSGSLTQLMAGEPPQPDVFCLWCRPGRTAPWMLEILIDESKGDMWLFRREPAVRRHLSEMTRSSPDGIPYVSPEVQLLYKAKNPRERDIVDFRRTVPALDLRGREWLLNALVVAYPGHDWIATLRENTTT